jgi:N-acetylmuramoyl-L-alanine amidase
MKKALCLIVIAAIGGTIVAGRSSTRSNADDSTPAAGREGDRAATKFPTEIGAELKRSGDEIVACGRLFHTSTRVVLWTDPGGYDAYRVERRFSPRDQAGWDATHAQVKALKQPNRFGLRKATLADDEIERVRGGGWDLDTLKRVVDQFVIHFDARGTSRGCFEILHDARGLSVQFLLDLDGTIYQTLDLKEGAWHATKANARSIGIEIANVGAYPAADRSVLNQWYIKENHNVRISIPDRLRGNLPRDSIFRPIRSAEIVGEIQDKTLVQYDFTGPQYDALIKLTATLTTIFPKIAIDYPRDPKGRLIPRKLDDDAYAKYQGVLGHYHVQLNKVDPGPAFQWDRLIDGTRRLKSRTR